MANFITEDMIEQAILKKLGEPAFGYDIVVCDASPDKKEDLNDGTGRSAKTECILPRVLEESLCRINPEIPAEKLTSVIKDLTADFSDSDLVSKNYELYNKIRNYIKVPVLKNGKEDFAFVKLIDFENPENNVRYLLVKPSDVAIYVEHHAADVGIVGKDILMESRPDVYELLDLGLGKCRMCVAAKNGYMEDKDRPLRVATKFVNIAKAHYASQNRDIDIIKLNGSIELAPILGLSDVIVDIVESGSTIRENNLQVIEEFMPISARFIANKSSFKFKNDIISEMVEKLAEAIKE